MTTQEFAQRIKQKYPEYSDIDDVELTNKIVAKYPEYKSQIDLQATTPQVPAVTPQKELSDTEKLIKRLKDVGFSSVEASEKAIKAEQNPLEKIGIEQDIQRRQIVSQGGGDPNYVPGNPLIGAAKGLGNTVAGGSELFQKYIANPVVNKILNKKGNTVSAAGGRPEELKKALTPSNFEEQVGYTAEQIGEYFLPGANQAKVGEFGKIGIDALQAAATASAQSGEVGQEAALAGGVTLAAGLVGSLAKHLGDFMYSRTVPTTIKESAKDFARGNNIGEAVSKTGVSMNRAQLQNKIVERIRPLAEGLGKSIDDVIDKAGDVKMTIKEITQNFSDDILKNSDTLRRLKATPVDVPKIKQVITETLDDYAKLYGKKPLGLKEMQKLKVSLGAGLESVFDKAVGAPIAAKPLTEIALRKELQTIIEKNVPNVGEINKQLAPLYEASKRISRKGNYSGFLTDFITGAYFSGGPEVLFSDPQKALTNAAKAILVKRALTSTLATTSAASSSKVIGDILKNKGLVNGIRELLTPQK